MFPDYIYIYDPEQESEFGGITDRIANYAFIEPIAQDATIVSDNTSFGRFWYRQPFKLIARCERCDKATLLAFCMNALTLTSGTNCILVTDQSERIYIEETDEEIRTDLILIRIIFEVSLPMECCDPCIELCENPPCSPVAVNVPIAQGAKSSANPVASTVVNPIPEKDDNCIDCLED